MGDDLVLETRWQLTMQGMFVCLIEECASTFSILSFGLTLPAYYFLALAFRIQIQLLFEMLQALSAQFVLPLNIH